MTTPLPPDAAPGDENAILPGDAVAPKALTTVALDNNNVVTADTALRLPDVAETGTDPVKKAAGYNALMRDLAETLARLVAAKHTPEQQPTLFDALLKTRTGVLGALDAYIRPLTAGQKTDTTFKPPEEVQKGLLLADEIFNQMRTVVQALLRNSLPPVAGAENLPLATRLWNDLTAGQILVHTKVAQTVESSTMDPDTKAVVKKEIRDVSAASRYDLFTRLAVLLHFRETCGAVDAVVSAAKAGPWLILVMGGGNTLATLPSNLALKADPLWKGSTGWHAGLVIGQEIDSTKLVPAGRLVDLPTGPQLRPDLDENKRWLGYTLAPREIYLSHELDHVKRQLAGGWKQGFAKGSEDAKVLTSPFSNLEEYRAIYDGELPLRGRLGLQPRGHSSASIRIGITVAKPSLKELLTYFSKI